MTLLAKRTFFLISIAYVVWRVFLQVFAWLSPRFLPFQPSYPYYDALLAPLGPWWLVRWAGFDGVHYLTIATKGYFGTGLIQAFFPVYPFAMYLFNFFHNLLISGLLVSHLSFVAALFLLYKLFRLDEKRNISVLATLCILIYPVSFFFASLYTESLFLLCIVGAMYFVRKKQWWMAALCAVVATATRITGIFIVPAIIVEAIMLSKKRNERTPWKIIAILSTGIIGLLLYMVYLGITFHDPLYFLHVQTAFGGGRQETPVLLPQVFYRYIRIFITARTTSPLLMYAYGQEFLMTLSIGLVLFFAALKKWLRPSYLLYSWGAYLLPPLTGTFQSMPRYMMVIFPLFLLQAKLWKHKPILFILLAIVLVIHLAINTMLFFQGHWVS